jgi:hypothetical protein
MDQKHPKRVLVRSAPNDELNVPLIEKKPAQGTKVVQKEFA